MLFKHYGTRYDLLGFSQTSDMTSYMLLAVQIRCNAEYHCTLKKMLSFLSAFLRDCSKKYKMPLCVFCQILSSISCQIHQTLKSEIIEHDAVHLSIQKISIKIPPKRGWTEVYFHLSFTFNQLDVQGIHLSITVPTHSF